MTEDQRHHSFYCSKCKKQKCLKCMDDAHPHKDGLPCDINKTVQQLKDFQDLVDEHGKKVKSMACPYCASIF